MSTEPDSARRRNPLPDGTLQVGGALLIAGVATYLFLVFGKRVVGGDDEFKPILSLWFALFALAPGFFLPLEQELGRALSARRARGEGGRPVVMKVLIVSLAINALILTVMLIAHRTIVDTYFDGDAVLLWALAIALTTYAPAHLARGISAGEGRFKSYAIVISSDGVVRIIGLMLLWALGAATVTNIAMLVGFSPIAAVLYVWWRGYLRTEDGPEARWAEVNQNLGWLLAGALAAAALLNAGVIAADLLTPKELDGEVSRFGYGVLVARVPLFLYQAIQAALLPRLSRLAAQHRFKEFRSGLRSLLLLVAGVGVVGVTGAFLLGPLIIKIAWKADLSGRTLAMLALSSALYMAALATGQAVIALNGHREVAAGWIAGVAVFVLGSMYGGGPVFRRVEIALVASGAIALVVFGASLVTRLRQGERPTAGAMWDAITDNPIET